MAGPGRDTKFDAPRRTSILRDLGKGNTRACAAERAGVSERTLTYWMARGKRGEEGGYVAFVAAVKKAERDAERRMVGVIRTASRKTWTAAAWWLERKKPADWGDQRDVAKQLKDTLKEVEALRERLRAALEEAGRPDSGKADPNPPRVAG